MRRLFCTMAQCSLIFLISIVTATVQGAEPTSCPGWKVEKVTQPGAVVDTCMATWTNGGPAELSIVAEGPLLTLTIFSPTFAGEKRVETVGLRKEGMDKLERTARFAQSTYGITIGNEVDAYLEQAGELIFTIKGLDYKFRVANAGSAIDAVRRCAGQPTKAEIQENKAPSFAVPDGWEALDVAGGCAGRLSGEQVDTMVSVNNNDQVLLFAGRPDWNSWGEEIKLALGIDSQPPVQFSAWKFNNLVLLLLVDDKEVQALRRASSLRWHLPNGDYDAKVHDVGPAIDAAMKCTRAKRANASH